MKSPAGTYLTVKCPVEFTLAMYMWPFSIDLAFGLRSSYGTDVPEGAAAEPEAPAFGSSAPAAAACWWLWRQLLGA